MKEFAMGVSLPGTFDVDVDVNSIPPIDVGVSSIPSITVSSIGSVGPVTVDGIPDTYNIYIEKLPKIELSIDPLEIKPVDISLRLKEIPSIRAHLPANFCVGMSVLGLELLAVRLCGEAQVITEPYQPNPCEHCGKLPKQAYEHLPSFTLKEP
jgi:hypothetical protein